MYYFMINYGLMIVGIIITLVAQAYVSISYRRYSQIRNTRNISGAEAARQILDKNGLSNIYVVETEGYLSDHYDPTRKVIKLSKQVYNGESIASVAVAAHECGHAIQDKEGYTPLRIRSKIVPMVNFASYTGYFAVLIGFLFGSDQLFWVGIALLCIILLFHLITLPVEFNASRRALSKLKSYTIMNDSDVNKARSVLMAAALTYVASLATTILQILRLILLHNNRRD